MEAVIENTTRNGVISDPGQEVGQPRGPEQGENPELVSRHDENRVVHRGASLGGLTKASEVKISWRPKTVRFKATLDFDIDWARENGAHEGSK
jgi:hypothetical protein